ncbi:molybdenum cofactor biosynthesis protein MoaE [Agromyces sp. MMS24-K17]|uniref:molybdenum cofactor biosynthesis protein MoaE n=1 Tax=Agromyces sp. MMS24-K17 TaxID=3372850 RepID=UPI003754700E
MAHADPVDDAVRVAVVSDAPIEIAALRDAAMSRADGAVVVFEGVVRDHDGGRGVTALAYTAHPSAGEVLAETARDIAARHPETTIAVAHRVGPLAIGDVALGAAVASAHRAEAFAACAELVDEVKARVPIWKEQRFTDGSSEWVSALD